MNKNMRVTLIIGGLAIAAYLGYRWWTGRQQSGGGLGLPQLGTNLNSLAPYLVAGPGGGVQYTAPTIDVTIPQSNPASPPAGTGGTPPKQGGGGTGPPWRRRHGHPGRRPWPVDKPGGGPTGVPVAVTGGVA